ncbi:MAG: glycosyltransferase family 2 protein [Thermodesulfovibrionales bacterium]|nr:glycosyltransferase family 2 protein [Thermodesulfovibrionales bacterium]
MESGLSITIITLNEEKNIGDCLESVKWADEIIIIDSGSTDRTVEICKKYTDKVFYNPWPGMNEQKALAMEKARGSWILNIDADERVTPELKKEIIDAIKHPRYDGYRFPRKNYFINKWMRHGGWYPDHVLRLFKKECAFYGGINPHDKVIIRSGRIGTLKSPLIHYTYSSLSQYITRQNNYSSAAALELLKRNKRVSAVMIPLKTLWKFIETYILKMGFLDGTHGMIAAIGASYSTFQKYSKLWELQKALKSS